MTTDARIYDEMCRWHGMDPLAEREVVAEAEALTEAGPRLLALEEWL